ncbi:MAG: endonuclease NucS, partial [Halobaculum sp.]
MTAVTLHDPSHREALWELESAFDRGDLITIFGSCTVEYDGRAASSLAEGRRLLVLKPDGTALIHTDEGRTPVNWQPPGCEHRAAVRDGRLRVRSSRDSPEEVLDV